MVQDAEMMDVEMQDAPRTPPHPDTERPLSPLFTPEGSEAGEDSEEEVGDSEVDCAYCKQSVSKWLDLIIPKEGERLSKIERMSEEERDMARKPYCLECANNQVWFWLLVNVEKGNSNRLTKAQWRGLTIDNLWKTFGLWQGVHERRMIADYYKFCRGCDNLEVLVKTAGDFCPPCTGLKKCSVCDRNERSGTRLVTIHGVIKCMKCFGGHLQRRVVTFQSGSPAKAPVERTNNDSEEARDESVVSDSDMD